MENPEKRTSHTGNVRKTKLRGAWHSQKMFAKPRPSGPAYLNCGTADQSEPRLRFGETGRSSRFRPERHLSVAHNGGGAYSPGPKRTCCRDPPSGGRPTCYLLTTCHFLSVTGHLRPATCSLRPTTMYLRYRRKKTWNARNIQKSAVYIAGLDVYFNTDTAKR